MGLIRKTMSVSTVGLIDFRSDKERTAAYARGTRKHARRAAGAAKKQAKGAEHQARVAAATVSDRRPLPAPQAGVFPASELERLSALHAQGALTDDEFAAAKANLLGL